MLAVPVLMVLEELKLVHRLDYSSMRWRMRLKSRRSTSVARLGSLPVLEKRVVHSLSIEVDVVGRFLGTADRV